MKKWLGIILFSTLLNAQIEEPVLWQSKIENIGENEYLLSFETNIAPGWHLYSQFSNPEGAIPTEFIFKQTSQYERIGNVEESPSIVAFDKVFEMDLTYFNDRAVFKQKIRRLDDDLKIIEVEINYQACDDKLCIFRTENFKLPFEGSVVEVNQELDEFSKERSKALQLNLTSTSFLKSTNVKEGTTSFLNIFLLGFVGGLLALLTPCVFPMIPLTVSFFLKQATTPRRGVVNAFLYAFFILLIYGLLSLPFHFIDTLNPEILNTLATNVYLNLLFFVVFVFFAFSFFGFYELTLPSKWGNTTDQASALKGSLGIFFMALTLAIVSFSCTGPILGSLLAGSFTTEGGAMQLSMGMLGFGLSLGLPFGLFALFPNSLNALPKSGSWMTSVKVTLGFLELALALKFLSNADLVAHWGILKRETFIVIWALISLALTLYLFGVFRFKKEEKKSKSPLRMIMGVAVFAFSLFLVVGLFSKENTLKVLSGFPPPEFYSLFAKESDCPLGLECYKDFETGKEVALSTGKPLLLDFTGWACVNCRKMEENVWSAPEVYALLKEKYILISLYVDDREPLPTEDHFNFQYPDGRIKRINTVGKKWSTFQTLNFKTASQPFYVQMTPEGNLLNTPIQYTDKESFFNWLETGLKNQLKTPKANYFNF